MIIDEAGTHVSHCCVVHGCKYNEDDCPVEVGTRKQYHPCEQCDDEKSKETSYGAHPTHCCRRHGCKYSYKAEGCPVAKGIVPQQYPCEQCVNVKEAEEEIRELEAEIAFVKTINPAFQKARENEASRRKYRLKMTVRSERVLDELLKKHEDDPKHKCDQCDGVFFIADDEHPSPFANDLPYGTNAVNTVKFEPDAFKSEIRGDDTKYWLCRQCQRHNSDEI